MKAVKIFAILLVTTFVILWVRGGDGFDIRRVLPLVNEKPGLYQGGGIVMIALLFWGLSRLRHRSDQTNDDAPVARDTSTTFDDEP